MASTLKGSKELNARLNAMKRAPKEIARKWAKTDIQEMQARVPVRTGALRRSFRILKLTDKSVRVGGSRTAYFVDAGPKPHDIRAKRGGFLVFQAGGKTIFARKVHSRGYRARPFRQKAAEEALRKNPQAAEVIKQWNAAA
jgi:hypothetical protein